MFVDGSCSNDRRGGMCATLAGEAVPGPSTSPTYQGVTESAEGPAPPLLVGIPLGDFPLKQRP